MAGSIGSIFVDFVVRTAQMQDGINDAVSKVAGGADSMSAGFGTVSTSSDAMTNAIERGGLRISAAFLGARTVAMALARDVRDVYTNFESIQGISPGAIESIRLMHYELDGSNSTLKQIIADGMAKFSDFGNQLGIGFGALVYGVDNASEAYDKLRQEADKFASAEHDAKMQAIQVRMQEIARTTGQLAEEYRQAGLAQMKLASASGSTPGDQWKAEEAAAEDFYKEQVKLNEEQKEYASLMERASAVADKFETKQLSTADAVAELEQKLKSLRTSQESVMGGNWYGDPLSLEIVNTKEKEIIATTQQLNTELNKLHEPAQMIEQTFQHAMESSSNVLAQFVTTGKAKFSEFFLSVEQEIVSMLIKLSLINPLINQIFGGTKGFSSLPAFSSGTSLISSVAGFLADGGPAQGGQPYVVGEEGPELFIPNGSGTVVPNGSRATISSGGGGLTVNYHIDSGVTRNELQPILEQHSRKIKSDIYAAKKRGGSPARAMA